VCVTSSEAVILSKVLRAVVLYMKKQIEGRCVLQLTLTANEVLVHDRFLQNPQQRAHAPWSAGYAAGMMLLTPEGLQPLSNELAETRTARASGLNPSIG
jgi:hypothetical protein